MQTRDLPRHGQPQPRAVARSFGRALIEPPENFFLLIGRNADAVVRYSQLYRAACAVQRDDDMAVFPAVAVGVSDEVAEQSRDERLIAGDGNIRLDVCSEGDVLLADQRHVLADGLGQRAQIERLASIAVGLALHAHELQHAGDHAVHAPPLTMDDGERLAVVRAGFLAGKRVLALRHDDGHGRAQLVRRVRGELPLGLEGVVQPLHHAVERAGQLRQLVAAAVGHALFQVVAAADLRRGERHGAQGLQRASGDQHAAGNGDERERQQAPDADVHDVAQRRVGPRFGHGAAQPQIAKGVLLEAAIKYIPGFSAHADCAAHAVLKGQHARRGDGVFAVEQRAVFVIERGDHAVHLIEKIVVDFEIAHAVADVVVGVAVLIHLRDASVKLDLVHIVLDGVYQLCAQLLLQDGMAHEEHHDECQHGHEHERGGKPQREFPLERASLHGVSSRST